MNNPSLPSKRAVASFLRESANKIAVFGHCKGAYRDGLAYCALGALGYDQCDETGKTHAALEALRKVTHKKFISVWNDLPETTGTDVIRAMRKTARALEHGLAIPVSRQEYL